MSSQSNSKVTDAVLASTIVGKRKSGFSSVHAVGIAAGLVGAAANFAEGRSIASSLVGGAVGAAVGYAVADVWNATPHDSATSKIIGGAVAGSFGLSFGSLASGLITSIEKLGSSAE